jgi:hypothetical protein
MIRTRGRVSAKWAPVSLATNAERVCAEIMLKQKDRLDDDSKKRHPNLGESTGQARRHGFEHRWHRKV